MAWTEEQIEAGRILNESIERAAKAHGAEGFVGDWVVVASEISFDEDDVVNSAYLTFFRNMSIPTHSAIGLLRMGQMHVENGTAAEERSEG